MYGLTPFIAALLKRITLDWGPTPNRKKPALEVMRIGALLANEDSV